MKVCLNSPGRDQAGPRAYIWLKPIKNLLWMQPAIDLETWYTALGTWALCLTKFVQMMTMSWPWHGHMCSLCITPGFLEIIEVCEVKDGTRWDDYWLSSRTSLKTEYESSMTVVYCYSFVVGLKSEYLQGWSQWVWLDWHPRIQP